ncbi:Sensory box/GGDEF family protein [Marinobacterium lacunae]|uniref:Sensory box/GGDEF family protein n=1 Tax=Marinobacterium lacunae TaxID=1232683 RepID=A0A081G1L4_9GAMM|nr:transporter substrate-binding domain-containing protein [Marinobacterium lacunae]KEA64669.1 Sensory box/GGDEF family protein [Marinobacterium lacunae]
MRKWVALLLFLFSSLACAGPEWIESTLNDEQKAWIGAHPRIDIGAMDAWPPMNFVDQRQRPQGIGADLVAALNRRLDGRLHIVSGAWQQVYEQTKQGELDALLDITPKPEREAYFNFTDPYLRIPHVIVARRDADYIADLNALRGKTVALESGIGTVKYLREHFPEIVIREYRDTSHCLGAVSSGEVDAYVGNRAVADYLITQELLNNLKIHGRDSTRAGSVLALGTPKNNPILRDILQLALDDIGQQEFNELLEPWTGVRTGNIGLTLQEKAWIAQHGEVKVGGELDWPPFDFVGQDGRYKGIARDIMDLVARKAGLRLHYETGLNWSAMLKAFQNGELDILPAMYESPTRAEFTTFTAPYFEIKDYAFMRQDASPPTSIEALAKLRVAVIDGYQIVDHLTRRFPDIQLVRVNTLQEGLDAVLLERADAYIDGYAVVNYQLSHSMQTGIKPVLPVDFYTNQLRVGVRKSAPLLAGIVQKAVASISDEEKNAIFLKWFGEQRDGAPTTAVVLSKAETSYLSNHPVIKVHLDKNWPPFSYVEAGQPRGLGISLMNLIGEKTGARIEYESEPTWDEAQKLMKQGELDVLLNVTPSAERAQYLDFTEPYLNALRGIVMRESDTPVQNLNDLLKKTIALPKGFYYTEYFKKHYPETSLFLVDSDLDALQAVAYGKADITIGIMAAHQYLMEKNYISNLKIVGLPKEKLFDPSPLALASRRDAPELNGILSKGLAAISTDEMRAMIQFWLGNSNRYPDPADLEALNLTEKEKAWLGSHQVIRYSEVNWKPLSVIDERGMTGIMGEYLALVSKRTGIEFQYVPSKSWPEVLTQFQNGVIDMVPGIGDSPEEKALGLLSDRFASYPMVIVTNSDIAYVRSLDELKDRTFALPNGYTSYNYLRKALPGANIIETRDIPEALVQVSSGKADVFLGHLAPVLYYMGRMPGAELRVAGNTDFQFNHHFLISPRYPELQSIVNKVFATLTEKEREQFYHDWVQVKVQQGFDYSLFWKALAVVMALTAIMVYWNRALKTRVRRATAELTALLESFNRHVIASKTDLNGQITYVSDAFCSISGYRRSELLGQNHRLIKHPENDPELYREMWRTIAEKRETWRGEIKNLRRDGSHFWVDAIIQPEYDLNGEHIGYSAIRQDITAKKEVEELSSSLERKVEARTEELRESQEYLAEVLDSQPSIVLTTDGRHIKTVNQAFLALYGLQSLDEFPHDCICDTFEQREGEHYLQRMMGEHNWIEYLRLHPGNTHVACIAGHLFTVSATAVDIGDEAIYLVVLTDITQLQAAQEELNRSRRLMHDLIDNTDAVIHVMDLSGNYLLVNRGWRTVFGMDSEVIGLDSPTTDQTAPTTIDPDQLPDEYKELTIREVTVPVDDQDNIFLSYRFPLHDHRGRLYATAGVAINITERKETERQLEAFNRKISDSIEYGSLIQTALLPEPDTLQAFFDTHFTVWQPKDVVGGDIFLFDPLRNDSEALLMVIDCTGHGVPGAFMTMLVKAVERGIVSDLRAGLQEVHPAEILQRFNRTIRTLLRQDNPGSASNAGLDGAVLYFDKARDILRYAGAETPLFYFDQARELNVIKGDRQGIGYRSSDPHYVFTEHELSISSLHSLLVTTDGYIDQNGGNKGFPFGKRRLKELLIEYRDQPLSELNDVLLGRLADWQGQEERSDDVTLVGIGFSAPD